MYLVKGGFLFSGSVGSGVVIVRNGEKWSSPSSISCASFSFGLQIGASVTDSVIILQNDAAVKSFSGQSQATLGASGSLALGTVGRSIYIYFIIL